MLGRDQRNRRASTIVMSSNCGEPPEKEGPDNANRHVPFLALGPDIKQGEAVDTRGDLSDIASTVAEILGLEMPFSEGRILSEMLITPAPESEASLPPRLLEGEIMISDTPAASLYPSVAMDSSMIHVVWSERDAGSLDERRFILSRRSSDGGVSWSRPDTVLSDFAYHRVGAPSGVGGAYGVFDGTGGYAYGGSVGLVTGGTPVSANVCITGDGREVIAVNGYSILSFTNRTELLWGVNLLSREGEGDWTECGFDNLGHIVATAPVIAVGDSGSWATWTDGSGWLSVARPRDGVDTSERDLQFPDLRANGYYYRTASLASSGGSLYLVSDLITNTIGKVIFMRIRESDLLVESTAVLDLANAPSLDPRVAAQGDDVYAVWSDLKSGMWQIEFTRSTDRGTSFLEAEVLSSSTAGAWNPDIAAAGDTLLVTWADYRDGNGEVYAVLSTDAGATWGPETRITFDDSFSAHPRAACGDSGWIVVWQDYRNGNWEIFARDLTGQIQ
jgi:hypothetical protein